MRIAFYCPTVDLSDDTPSGDRRMADLLIAALRLAGHEVVIASRLRSYGKAADAARLIKLEDEASRDRNHLVRRFGEGGQAPDLWFTYHPYYKAPDLIGPLLSQTFSIPYVTAEASFAGKRAAGPWADWHKASLPALARAACHFIFTARDREGLLAGGVEQSAMVDLPPFIDTAPFLTVAGPRLRNRPPHMVCVAMMRGGRKLQSFRDLANALARLGDIGWRLTLYGDGPQRAAVEAAFAVLPAGRIHFAGRIAPQDLPAALAGADLYVWPGLGEAYGLAYLEAQAAGLPVVAYDSGGVSACVEDGQTGLLVGENDDAGFAAAIRSLLQNSELRDRLGSEACTMVLTKRSLSVAAERLEAALSLIVPASPSWRQVMP